MKHTQSIANAITQASRLRAELARVGAPTTETGKHIRFLSKLAGRQPTLPARSS